MFKLDRDKLEAMSKKELVAICKQARKDGHEVGTLTRGIPELISSLMELEFTQQDQIPAIPDQEGSKPVSEDDAEMIALEKRMKELKARKATAEQDEPKPSQIKLVAPSKLAEPVTTAMFRTWMREYKQWLALYSGVYSDAALLQSALLALGTETKEAVFAEVPAGTLTLASVQETLHRLYAGDELLEQRKALADVRALRRGKSSLHDFLRQWKHVRATAQVAGVLPSSEAESDAWDMLEASELTNSQRGSILAELQTRRDLCAVSPGMTFSASDTMYNLLRNLALAFEATNPSSNKTSRQEEKMALYASAPEDLAGGWKGEHWALAAKGKGKKGSKGSKGSKGGAKGDQPVECWTCGKKGHRSSECWSSKGSKGSAKGKKDDQKGKGKGKKVTCYKCGKEGHMSFECRGGKKEEPGVTKAER